MALLGWLVLFLVFVGEILGIAALADWGAHQGGSWMAVLCGAVALAVWFLLAAPGARFADRFTRPIVKLALFLIATAALWTSGHETLALWFLLSMAVLNAIAMLPSIRVLND